MQRYFKIVHTDRSIGLFDSNTKLLIEAAKQTFEKQGNEVIEITEDEYTELQNDIP